MTTKAHLAQKDTTPASFWDLCHVQRRTLSRVWRRKTLRTSEAVSGMVMRSPARVELKVSRTRPIMVLASRRSGNPKAKPLELFVFATCFLAALGYPLLARGDEDSSKSTTALPNIYLDLNEVYSRVPANTLSIGFGNLFLLSNSPSQNIAINAPFTVDVTDRLSLYAGVSGSTTQAGFSSWSPATLDSWNVGFQADVIQQSGSIPTVTLQSTLTMPIQANALGLAASTWANIVETDYALNKDQTKGILAGVKYTGVSVTSEHAVLNPTVAPTYIGYVGSYYQWDSNWKLTGRFGVQSFGGADIGRVIQVRGFTQPILRIDLDKMDDNDNRLFAVFAEIAWTPKPVFQLTLRTPIYAVRN
ncbi:MAG: hypothetical protein ACXWKP_08515 [Bradyrhizobium sp.]